MIVILAQMVAALSPATCPVHHVAVRTANIRNAMSFYSLLGFEEETRFLMGPARCAWLRNTNMRLELIQTVSDGERIDVFNNTEALGLNHIAINVTSFGSIFEFLIRLNDDSERLCQRSVKILEPPYQAMIGQDIYAVAFVQGPDGVVIELIAYDTTLPQKMVPAW